jgi:hypothetical protein
MTFRAFQVLNGVSFGMRLFRRGPDGDHPGGPTHGPVRHLGVGLPTGLVGLLRARRA